MDPNAILEALKGVSTPTITTLLLKKGLRNVWMRGPKWQGASPTRLVGPAFTLRFIPAREDLATTAAWASPTSTRAAIEDMPPGVIVVASTPNTLDAGIFGDILCARMVRRGVAGLRRVDEGAGQEGESGRRPPFCASERSGTRTRALTISLARSLLTGEDAQPSPGLRDGAAQEGRGGL